MPANSSADKASASGSSSPEKNAPYENIPLQGTHRGETDDPVTSSVRAQTPPNPTSSAERVEEDNEDEGQKRESEEHEPEASGDIRTYQLSRDPESGRHRVRVGPEDEKLDVPSGSFEELSRHTSPEEMNDALESGLPDGPRFVVLENTDTGDTVFEREGRLTDDWFAEGDFDQVTIFDREEEAAKYASARRSEGEE